MEIDKEKIDQVLSQSAESNCPVVSASVLSAEAIIYRGDFGLAEVSAKKIKFIYSYQNVLCSCGIRKKIFETWYTIFTTLYIEVISNLISF